METDRKLQILQESFRNSTTTEGFKGFVDFVEAQAEYDPCFYRWFFDKDLKEDFDTSLTDDQRHSFDDFIQSLKRGQDK
ncbi:MAG: hypothetical protein KKC03_13300 [Bacteroidetes bacterium]|nr:hypothetical protein [Bacteroidota bacterium]